MKNSQTLVIGFLSIIVITILFVQLFITEFDNLFKNDNKFRIVQDEATRISNSLVAHSSPYTWNDVSEVKKIGLLTNDVIENKTLVKISKIPYSEFKLKLGINKDFIFLLKYNNKVINVSNIEYWGWNMSNTDKSNGGGEVNDVLSIIQSKAKYLATAEKFVPMHLINNESVAIVTLLVYSWE